MAATLVDFIQSDLRSSIAQKSKWSETLTLEALASRYKVSTTPVRQAVRQLVAARVLVKYPNGCLGIRPEAARATSAAGSANDPPAIPPDPFKVEGILTEEIVRLSLRGVDAFLREESTSERFGIGRTVLRQVFNRLVGKGLLEHVPRRGWRVHPYSELEMRAYLDVRVTLELTALDLAKPHLLEEDLERMLRGNQPAPTTQAERLDNHLHQYLIEKSGNRYLRAFFEQHGAYHTHLFEFAAPGAKVVKAMAKQHRDILRALINKDWPRAGKFLTHHIRAQGPIVKRLLKSIRGEV